jgi:hypothetical protein
MNYFLLFHTGFGFAQKSSEKQKEEDSSKKLFRANPGNLLMNRKKEYKFNRMVPTVAVFKSFFVD